MGFLDNVIKNPIQHIGGGIAGGAIGGPIGSAIGTYYGTDNLGQLPKDIGLQPGEEFSHRLAEPSEELKNEVLMLVKTQNYKMKQAQHNERGKNNSNKCK